MSDPESQPQDQPGIPIISKKTLEALKSQYTDNSGDGQTWGERLTDMQEKVVATNPVLIEFIEMQIKKYPRELQQPIFEVLVGTMVLIERQAEADAMNASFPDVDPEE